MLRSVPPRPVNKNSPGRLLATFKSSSTAWRVCSVSSNLTGRPVFFCRTVARSAVYPLAAISSTLIATTSQPRSLLSIAKLNMARSRERGLDLEFGPDRPDVFGSQRRLRPGHLALVPRHSPMGRGGCIHLILHGHTPRLQGRAACAQGIGIRSAFGALRTSHLAQRRATGSD